MVTKLLYKIILNYLNDVFKHHSKQTKRRGRPAFFIILDLWST